ncbi:MAG: hypothetical protein M3P33_03415 [bacterium]|nr:hypothetical protein [bacterium]
MVNYQASYLPKSKIQVILDIDSDQLKLAYAKSLIKISQKTELKGFRKGKAPSDMVESVVGSEKIYEDAINSLLPKQLEEALKQESEKDKSKQFIVLDYPQFKTEGEWKPGEALKVKAECTLYPSVDISNLDKLEVSKVEKKPVIDADIDESINKIFEQYKAIKANDKKDKESNVHHQKEQSLFLGAQGNSLIDRKDPEVVIDDEFAVAAGATSLSNLRELIQKELETNADQEVLKTFENDLIKNAIQLTDIDVPDMLIEEELNRIQQRFQSQLDRFGMSLESYLASESKKLEDQRQEWKVQAVDNTKIALILSEIQRQNKIEVTDQEIQLLASQSGLNTSISNDQYVSIRYIVGQTKALEELKKMAKLN